MIWLFLLALSVMSLGVTLWLFKKPVPLSARDDEHGGASSLIELFRSELDELETEHQRELLTDEQYGNLKREIEKRLLKAHRDGALGESDDDLATGGTTGRYVRMAFAGAVPVLALIIYMGIGRPDLLLTEPTEEVAFSNPLFDDPRIREAIAELEVEVAANPDNLELLLRLGQARLLEGRYRDAFDVYEQAISLDEDLFEARLGVFEARVGAAGNFLGPEEEQMFRELQREQPNHERIGFYMGVLRYQQGAEEEAFKIWSRVFVTMPEDSTWQRQVYTVVLNTAGELGIDPDAHFAGLEAERRERLTQSALMDDDMAQQVMRMNPEDRQEMILSMVARLESRLEDEPDDLEGWLRLAQVHTVLGNPEKMSAAYDQALLLSDDDSDILRRYASALLGPDDPDTGLPDIGLKSLQLYLRLVELEPEDSEAHWYLGIFALQNGLLDDARRHWTKTLAGIPAESPDYQYIEALVEDLLTVNEPLTNSE